MSLRLGLLAGLSALALSSTAAFADLIGVTSYDMNNGNGATQFTTPTGAQNYFDFTYTNSTTHVLDPNAGKNGSNQLVPNNAAPKNAPLAGGTGKLTDGVIAEQVYSLVSSTNGTISNATYLNGQPSQYVGWKYQDPQITFHLAAGQNVGSIALFVANYNPAIGDMNGLVAAPKDVLLNIDGQNVLVSMATKAINAFTQEIILSGFGAVSSSSTFKLTLEARPVAAGRNRLLQRSH